ncbi:MAG: hypothetical protein AAFY76_08410, partial [Cyanobacteria bacterium J06649_11]
FKLYAHTLRSMTKPQKIQINQKDFVPKISNTGHLERLTFKVGKKRMKEQKSTLLLKKSPSRILHFVVYKRCDGEV